MNGVEYDIRLLSFCIDGSTDTHCCFFFSLGLADENGSGLAVLQTRPDCEEVNEYDGAWFRCSQCSVWMRSWV